jgi:hypothetical protein
MAEIFFAEFGMAAFVMFLERLKRDSGFVPQQPDYFIILLPRVGAL